MPQGRTAPTHYRTTTYAEMMPQGTHPHTWVDLQAVQVGVAAPGRVLVHTVAQQLVEHLYLNADLGARGGVQVGVGVCRVARLVHLLLARVKRKACACQVAAAPCRAFKNGGGSLCESGALLAQWMLLRWDTGFRTHLELLG